MVNSALRRFATSLSRGKQILLPVLLLYLDFFTAFFSPVGSRFSVCLLIVFASFYFLVTKNFLRFTQVYCEVYFVLCLLVGSRLVYLHTPRALGGVTYCSVYLARCVLSALLLCVSCRFFQAALAIGALQVLVVTSLCLFARCSCHRSFAGACD